MSRYPYIDRHPCIVAAGKRIGDPSSNTKDLFYDVRTIDKVEAVKKQFEPVESKKLSEGSIKPTPQDTSGAFTEIRHCLRPPLLSPFQRLNEEIKNTIYDSYWNKPLGGTRDQTPGLPAGMDREKVTMGKPGDYTISGEDLINPPKKAELVQEEDEFYHDLYAFSHQDYYPGEQIKLGYKPPFDQNKVYGRSSDKDESGARTKQSLRWFNNDPICHVSRRLAGVRNRVLPTLGAALDKTGVTDLFPVDHTFGKPNPREFYGVEDLLNECPPSLIRRDTLTFLAYVNNLRQCVFKKISNGDIILEELYEEIISLNKDTDNSDCSVHFDCIDRIMKRYRIYLDKSKLLPLLLMLEMLTEDGYIKVRDFINIIDRNSRFPDLKPQYYILPKEFCDCNNKNPYEDENPDNDYRILSLPPAGIPTVRLDKPQPIFKDSIVNMDHLSEETTARTVISPSIHTQYGLSHRDFFQPRTKEFLGQLFRKINVTITDEELDDIYQEGLDLDKTGGVCIETFRNILDDRAYKAYNKYT